MARGEERERKTRAVYIISVAAELAGVHPQTLRIYERKGLLRPARTAGNTRRYSERDIDRLRRIQELTERGINLAGGKRIIEMQAELERMREEVARIHRELEQTKRRLREGDRGASEIVPLRSLRTSPWEDRP
jgi:MerR family transcriptional regulator/heat shock protein HspR